MMHIFILVYWISLMFMFSVGNAVINTYLLCRLIEEPRLEYVHKIMSCSTKVQCSAVKLLILYSFEMLSFWTKVNCSFLLISPLLLRANFWAINHDSNYRNSQISVWQNKRNEATNTHKNNNNAVDEHRSDCRDAFCSQIGQVNTDKMARSGTSTATTLIYHRDIC